MEKVFSFDSSKEHYFGAVCILWCFDDRFSALLQALIKGREIKNADVVESAGGAKALASPAGPERDFVLTQIKLSVKLHGTKKTILMLHMDCGGYGGSGTFNNDRDAEMKHHDAELSAARAFLLREIPEMEVECLIADFDGLYTAGEKQQ